ncbi:MAG TPA: phosphatidate cytidylyltransferase [Candidatus Aquilonibacter sp.]|nr:phosphatidate cytidylyltransferase [Candidatus Aquilonibacter sp.]
MKRILTAIVLIVLVGLLIFFGKLWMVTLFAGLVALLAAIEFRQLSASSGNPIPLWWTLFAIAAFFLATFLRPQDTITAVVFATLLLFGWNTFRTPLARVLPETAAGLLLLIYIAFPLTLIPLIWNRDQGDGLVLVIFLFLCVWSGDIAALYVGKRFGRHKLAPTLSPNKTWEGAVASVVASVIFGLALILYGDWLTVHGSSFARLHTNAPWWQFLLLAILLNAAAQFGDLLESALKRGANVKDSGTLLPGHGGVLDRIDALLLAAPVLWFVLVIREFFALGSF